MASVNVGTGVAKPTHDLGLSHSGDTMGIKFENGTLSMLETPFSAQPQAFQWSQSTWTGGRGNARSSNDNTAFFDSGSMWTLTPETLHPGLQWNIGTGIYTDDRYLPNDRGVSWRGLFGESRGIATMFIAGSSYTMDAFYVYLRAVGKPPQMSYFLCADNAGVPGTTLQSGTVDLSELNYDTLSQWKRLAITAQALTSGTHYWLTFYGSGTGTNSSNHWEIGGQQDIGGDYYSPNGAAPWTVSADSWRFLYRTHDAFRVATKVSSFELYTCPYMCVSYTLSTRIYINGDLCKASAGSANTITTTPAITWAANQFSGAALKIVAGTGAGTRAVVIASHTIGAGAVVTITGTFDITPDATSIFVIYNTPIWTQVTGHGITAILRSKVAVTNNIAYFAQGAGTNIRRMYFDVATGAYNYADDGTNKANFVHAFKGYLWRTLDGTATTDVSFAPAVAAGTNLTFGTAVACGTPSYPVNNLIDHDDSIFVFKSDNIYQITNGVAILVNFGMNKFPSLYNGRAAVSSGSSLYFTVLQGLERYTNGTVDDIGWNRHEGLPVDRGGAATTAMIYGSWVFFGIDAGESGRSSVLVWNGQGWHELFRAFQDGHEITHICMTTPNRLWVFIEDDAYYLNMPNNITNPLKSTGSRYMHEGYITTSTIDLNKIGLNKIFRELILQTVNLSDTQYIYVDYQVDDMIGAEEWYVVGGTNYSAAAANLFAFYSAIKERILASPFDNVEINRDHARLIRFRLRFCTEQSYFLPILYDMQLNGVVADPPKYQWNVTARVASEISDFKADDVVAWLKDAAQNMRLCKAHSSSVTLDNRWVYVSQPTIMRESETTQTKKWNGRITFTLREP